MLWGQSPISQAGRQLAAAFEALLDIVQLQDRINPPDAPHPTHGGLQRITEELLLQSGCRRPELLCPVKPDM